MPLLAVDQLVTAFQTDDGLLTAVDGVSFTVEPGRTVGLVGESGCGKSVTAFSLNRLLPQPSGRIVSGSVMFDGKDLTKISDEEIRKIRGRDIGMIFQEPMSALNPVHRIGKQLSEVFLLHTDCSKKEAWEKSIAMLRKVGIPSPELRAMDFPHQLSGGMRQRVVIAMALALKPRLVIADEPTTALDVTVQAQILELMKDLQGEMGMGILLITHDLGVIAETCDEVVVMYAGRVVERASAADLFARPRHAYTRGLLESIPRLETPHQSRLPIIPGMVPPLHLMPAGCRFCERNGAPPDSPTLRTRPNFLEAAPGHWVEACPRCAMSEPGPLVIGRSRERAGEGPTHPADPADPADRADAAAPDASTSPAPTGPRIPAWGTAPGNQPENPLRPEGAPQNETLLTVTNLQVHFPVLGGVFRTRVASCKAVDGVSFTLHRGETLGLIGESGCGKTTLGKAIVRLYEPTAGSLVFENTDITRASRAAMKPLRRNLQMIFQDPVESLNPRHTVGAILEEPFQIHRIGTAAERRKRVDELLDQVGLPATAAGRFPFEFSGGQRQRIGIARAIALNPRLIVCDEPVSALDVSVQSQVINLMMDLQNRLGLTYLFIAHNLAVVKHISDRIAIMYLGRIMEIGPSSEVYRNPQHAYTRALIAAIPEPDPATPPARALLRGDIPSPVNPPPGCAFGARMKAAGYEQSIGMDLTLREVRPGHFVQPCPCCTSLS